VIRLRLGSSLGVSPGLRRDARGAGFTLTEVLVAMVVVSTSLTIITQGFLSGGRASLSSQNESRAAWLAESKMVELETGILSASASGSGTFEPEHPDYSWTAEPESTLTTGLSKITVTVTWKEREQERTFVLTRLMAERASE
jgi:type II secretion system protein I